MESRYKAINLLFFPKKYFNPKKYKSNVKECLTTLLITTLIGFLFALSSFYFNFFELPIAIDLVKTAFSSWIFVAIFTIPSLLLTAIILQFFIVMVGKSTKPFSYTFEIVSYSEIPVILLQWFPYFSFIAFLYSGYVSIIGVKAIHRISYSKSIAIHVISVLFLIGLLILF